MPKWYGGYILNEDESPGDQWKLQWDRVNRWFSITQQLKTKRETVELSAWDFDILVRSFRIAIISGIG